MINPYAEYAKSRDLSEKIPLSEKEKNRIIATLSLIPEDVKSVLDMGCGDGRITNLLADKYWVVGTDFILYQLKSIKSAKTCTNIDKLAFKEKSFDLVMLTEVLEHLPNGVFEEALANVQKTSRKYILISVPYRQNLKSGLIKCDDCGEIFHVWYHLRRFKNQKELKNIFSNYTLIKYEFWGEKREYRNSLLLILKQYLGNRWCKADESTICPKCGNKEFTYTPRNLVTMICGAAEMLLKKIIPTQQKTWVGALYVRSDE